MQQSWTTGMNIGDWDEVSFRILLFAVVFILLFSFELIRSGKAVYRDVGVSCPLVLYVTGTRGSTVQ